MTVAQLVDLIAEAAGRPVKTRRGTAPAPRAPGLFNPTMRELVEMMCEWTGPFVMDSGEFERAFGVRPTPLREAVRETITWVRRHRT